jgi:hypothetical protein
VTRTLTLRRDALAPAEPTNVADYQLTLIPATYASVDTECHEVVQGIRCTDFEVPRLCLNLFRQGVDRLRSRILLESTTLASGVPFSWCQKQKRFFGGCMAKIIEFYIPQSLRKMSKWFLPTHRGKVLTFPLAVRKSA